MTPCTRGGSQFENIELVGIWMFTRSRPVFQRAFCANIPILNMCVRVFVLVCVCVCVCTVRVCVLMCVVRVCVCVCGQVLCPYFSTHCVLTSGLVCM